MFKIGDFSKLCRVQTSALRYYDELGLLRPAQTDPLTGYRYYTAEQLPRLNRILALKDLGLSLDQIKLVLDEPLSADELRGMLRLKQSEIQQRVDEEQARLIRVAARLKQIEQEGKMPTQEIVIKKIEPQFVLAIRQIIALPSGVADVMTEAFTTIMPMGVQPVGAPIAIFYDEEFKPTDLDFELAIPVGASVAPSIALSNGRALTTRTLDAVEEAACIIHHGTFDEITNSYAAMGQWIVSNGYRIAGASREVYLTAPDEQGRSITEIQYPVSKA